MAHNSIKNNDPHFLPLKANFEYMLNFGEVRATQVVATLVNVVSGFENCGDTVDNVYLPILIVIVITTSGIWQDWVIT